MDVAYHPQTQQIGLMCGTCYLHDEDYLGPQGNNAPRQIILKHEVENGRYDLMAVSLRFLQKRYLVDLLKSIAPTVATVLGGPLAGLAVKTLGDAIGIDEPTQDKIERALTGSQLTAEQILAIKNAEQALVVKMKELDIRLEEVEGKDRDSARQMQIQTRARTPAVLSWVIVTAALGLEGYVMTQGIPVAVQDVVAGRILGTLDAALLTVITFWLGAAHQTQSRGADRK
jgi:hypothetical protein